MLKPFHDLKRRKLIDGIAKDRTKGQLNLKCPTCKMSDYINLITMLSKNRIFFGGGGVGAGVTYLKMYS